MTGSGRMGHSNHSLTRFAAHLEPEMPPKEMLQERGSAASTDDWQQQPVSCVHLVI